MAASPNPWLVRFGAAPTSGLRVFAFPCACGGPPAYRGLWKELGERADLVVVHLPGRESRVHETPIDDLEVLVARAAEAIAGHLPRGAYALFGQSMGAQLAFRVTRAIATGGGPAPVAVVVSSAAPAHLPRTAPNVHQLSDDELARALEAMGGTPSPVLADPELRAWILRTARADFRALERAAPVRPEPLETTIVAYAGRDDGTLDEEALRGWSALAGRSFRSRWFLGGHFFVQSHPRLVADALLLDLAIR